MSHYDFTLMCSLHLLKMSGPPMSLADLPAPAITAMCASLNVHDIAYLALAIPAPGIRLGRDVHIVRATVPDQRPRL